MKIIHSTKVSCFHISERHGPTLVAGPKGFAGCGRIVLSGFEGGASPNGLVDIVVAHSISKQKSTNEYSTTNIYMFSLLYV